MCVGEGGSMQVLLTSLACEGWNVKRKQVFLSEVSMGGWEEKNMKREARERREK